MRITLESGVLMIEINGQKVPLAEVKCLTADQIREIAGQAMPLLADGSIRFVRAEGSLKPPDPVKRRYEMATRRFRRSEAMLSEF